jgi:hypothetical protein
MRAALKIVLIIFWLGWMAIIMLGGHLSSWVEGILVALFSAAIMIGTYWFYVGVGFLILRLFRSATRPKPEAD